MKPYAYFVPIILKTLLMGQEKKNKVIEQELKKPGLDAKDKEMLEAIRTGKAKNPNH